MNALISYQFDEEPVRVVMIADDPWFVATDVARVLGHKRAPDMVRSLDDDEKGVHIVHTLGGEQQVSIISESGLYAAIFKSRQAEAQRFRKWVTSEVLPELRRTGRYILHDEPSPAPVALDHDPARLIASVSVVREARRLFGPRGARSVWVQLGLPVCIADAVTGEQVDPLAEPLADWLRGRNEVTASDAATGAGLIAPHDFSTLQRVGALLRAMGWAREVRRINRRPTRVWVRPERVGVIVETADGDA